MTKPQDGVISLHHSANETLSIAENRTRVAKKHFEPLNPTRPEATRLGLFCHEVLALSN